MLTAMVTPFTDDGSLDLAAAQKVASHLVDNGHDGVVISGTTGESPTTTDAEKDELLRAVLEAVGDRAHVVAGVGTFDTEHTIESARSAEKAGASGLLVVTPYYNKPPQSGLLAHFRAVADATGLDVLLYDIPARTATPIAPETLIALAEHPRIVAVKDAKCDLYAATQVLAATDLAYYSGADEATLALLAMGAVGTVSVVGHVAGPQYAEMISAVEAGDLDRARAIDRALVPAVRAIMTRTQGAIMAKAALELLGVLGNRRMRLPLVAATDDEVAVLREGLVAAGLAA
jgi:4-hydroxy-tetrahydrodipicolinate synthase